jgi:hypothetical protein
MSEMERLKKRLPIKMLFLESLFEDRPTAFSIIIVFFIVMVVSNSILHNGFINSFYSFAQQTEKNPGFQDSYWTDKTVAAGNDSNKLEEKEVGPGEGIATLAIVLVNKAQSDISAIKGYLSLPDEFEAVKPKNTTNNISFSPDDNISNISVASYDSIVKPGQQFTLYFDIYIEKEAKVGSYYRYLDLAYSKVLTAGDITVKDIPVSFRIPGKEILDVETKNQYLSPTKINKVGINIINKGSADANNAIITISNDADNVEGSLAYISESSSIESVQQTNPTTSNITNKTSSSSTANDQTDENITSSSITTFGTLKYDVGNIGPGEVVSINSLIYPSTSAAGTLQNLHIQISYGNSIGNRETVDYNLGLVINAEPTESNFNVFFKDDEFDTGMASGQGGIDNNKISNSSMITAGSIEDLIFAIKKSSTQSNIQDVVISLQPSSESVKIVGPSRWSFDSIEEDTLLNTTLFASEELIGKPVQLDFNLDYLLDGIAKSETLDVGLYVDGKISVRAYDFEINIVGDEPNLVANLLNEGNTDALFTTAEMISPSSTQKANSTFISDDGNKNDNSTAGNLVDEYPPLQYLGDLAENSPLPVSIPLKIPNNTNPGNYPVFIEISYKDNLRNSHNLVVNGTVNYSPQIESSSGDTGLILGFINPVILLVLILVTILVVYFIIRRFRKRKKDKWMKSSMSSENSDNELDSILRDSD